MGKVVSDTQLKIIKEKVKRVYVALDPDAWKEIDNICRKLHGELEVYILQPPEGRKDLGECSEEEVFEQFKQAKKYSGQLLIKI